MSFGFGSSDCVSGIVSSEYIAAQREIETVLVRNITDVLSAHHSSISPIERISEIPDLIALVLETLSLTERRLSVAKSRLVEVERNGVVVGSSSGAIHDLDEMLETKQAQIDRLLREKKLMVEQHGKVVEELRQEVLRLKRVAEFEVGRSKEVVGNATQVSHAKEVVIRSLEDTVDALRRRLYEKESSLNERVVEVCELKSELMEKSVLATATKQQREGERTLERERLVSSRSPSGESSVESQVAVLQSHLRLRDREVKTLAQRLRDSEAICETEKSVWRTELESTRREIGRLTSQLASVKCQLDKAEVEISQAKLVEQRRVAIMAGESKHGASLKWNSDAPSVAPTGVTVSSTLSDIDVDIFGEKIEWLKREIVLEREKGSSVKAQLEQRIGELETELKRQHEEILIRLAGSEVVEKELESLRGQYEVVGKEVISLEKRICKFEESERNESKREDHRLELEAEIEVLRSMLREVKVEIDGSLMEAVMGGGALSQVTLNATLIDVVDSVTEGMLTDTVECLGVATEYDLRTPPLEDVEVQAGVDVSEQGVNTERRVEVHVVGTNTEDVLPATHACGVIDGVSVSTTTEELRTLSVETAEQVRVPPCSTELMKMDRSYMLAEDRCSSLMRELSVAKQCILAEEVKRKRLQQAAAEMCEKSTNLWHKFYNNAPNSSS